MDPIHEKETNNWRYPTIFSRSTMIMGERIPPQNLDGKFVHPKFDVCLIFVQWIEVRPTIFGLPTTHGNNLKVFLTLKILGYNPYLEDHPNLIKWLISIVKKSPTRRVVPLPNDLNGL